MTVRNHNTAVANERPAVGAQNPVASGSKDRRGDTSGIEQRFPIGTVVILRSRFNHALPQWFGPRATVVGYSTHQTGRPALLVTASESHDPIIWNENLTIIEQ